MSSSLVPSLQGQCVSLKQFRRVQPSGESGPRVLWIRLVLARIAATGGDAHPSRGPRKAEAVTNPSHVPLSCPRAIVLLPGSRGGCVCIIVQASPRQVFAAAG